MNQALILDNNSDYRDILQYRLQNQYHIPTLGLSLFDKDLKTHLLNPCFTLIISDQPTLITPSTVNVHQFLLKHRPDVTLIFFIDKHREDLQYPPLDQVLYAIVDKLDFNLLFNKIQESHLLKPKTFS